jgi:hypothetical protein
VHRDRSTDTIVEDLSDDRLSMTFYGEACADATNIVGTTRTAGASV